MIQRVAMLKIRIGAKFSITASKYLYLGLQRLNMKMTFSSTIEMLYHSWKKYMDYYYA